MSFKKFIQKENKIFVVSLIIFFIPIIFLYFWFFPTGKEKLFFDIMNEWQGFFTLYAILFAYVLWSVDYFYKRYIHREEQERYLQLLLLKIEYLSKSGIMRIFGEEQRISVVDWYQKVISVGGLPTHRLPSIDADFFARVLDNTIDGKSTLELKKALFFIRDKIEMANYWLDYMWNNDFEIEHVENERKQYIINHLKKAQSFLEEATVTLKNFSAETRIHIEERFGIKTLQE